MIWVSPQSRLDETLMASRARHLLALVSDAAAFVRPQLVAPSDLCLLEFNDISAPVAGLVLPQMRHVEALLEFYQALPDGAPLAICCYAGISRSTAAAYLCAAAREPDLSEVVLADRLRARAPSATPNIRLVALADQFMGRNGGMTAAILGIGRGAEAFEGEPFHMATDASRENGFQ